jgi:hypothetical protein
MKITIISLFLILFAVGCSKTGNANAPIRSLIARGDIALAEIATNNYGGHIYYSIQIKPSSAKEAELYKLAQQYPNREIEVIVGSNITKMQMPAAALKPPIEWTVPCPSLDAAKVTEQALKKLSQ